MDKVDLSSLDMLRTLAKNIKVGDIIATLSYKEISQLRKFVKDEGRDIYFCIYGHSTPIVIVMNSLMKTDSMGMDTDY
jgi:hypothetical protein